MPTARFLQPDYTANLCLFFGWVEFPGLGEDLDDAIGKAMEKASRGMVGIRHPCATDWPRLMSRSHRGRSQAAREGAVSL